MADTTDLTEEQRNRLDVEWMTTGALRDALVIAHGRPEEITYKQAFSFGAQVAPELYLSVDRILDNPKESIGVQEIRQRASAQSALEGRHISALDYIESEIAKLRQQIDAHPDPHLLEKILARYDAYRQEIRPREYRETALIIGDAVHTGKGLPGSGEGRGYNDYLLNKERMLRVRVTHMEKPEDRLGCDLIYENLDFKRETARIIIIQYKMWEKYDQVLHWDQRDEKQYIRLEGATCKSRLCDPESVSYRTFRMPNCTAFVRPTDRLQEPNSPLHSSSLHIPICVMKESWQVNQGKGKSIRRPQVESRALSHRTFGELFDNCMVGSKEITWDEMTALYRGFGIFESHDRVYVHVQDARGL
jgi:hypothetical protein